MLEPLDAVAVAKLETAIEVLLSAGSTKESTSRILDGLESMLGKAPDDPISANSTVKVKTFVESVVTARSRVLHGTWPTITNSLPARSGLYVGFAEVEDLARTLLVEMSLRLDAYVAAGQIADDSRSLMKWVRSFHAQAPAQSTPSGAATPSAGTSEAENP